MYNLEVPERKGPIYTRDVAFPDNGGEQRKVCPGAFCGPMPYQGKPPVGQTFQKCEYLAAFAEMIAFRQEI